MASDQYGREILSSPLPGGGARYYCADGSLSTALKPANPQAALAIFNANPPAGFQSAPDVEAPGGDDLLTQIENLNTTQRQRLKRALLKIQG